MSQIDYRIMGHIMLKVYIQISFEKVVLLILGYFSNNKQLSSQPVLCLSVFLELIILQTNKVFLKFLQRSYQIRMSNPFFL